MENYATSTTYPFAQPVVTHGAALAGTWTAYGVQVARVTAPLAAAVQGTGMPISGRNRTAAASKTALLPISDVVVFDGLAGIRSWSPPV